MFARTDTKRMSIAVMIAVAIVVAAIPTCQMLGCDMGMANGMMAVWTHGGAALGNACSGAWVTSATQDGIAPNQSLNFLISLIAAIAAAVVLFSPRMELRPVRLVDANGPPPPLEPRGERFTV